jgi:hypothetical protein
MSAITGSRLAAWIATAVLAVASLVTVTPAASATVAISYLVDTVADNAALSACTVAAGDCSLRGAIAAANAKAGPDIIDFDIPAASCPGGVCRLTLTEGPLMITDAVTLDGTTQPQNDAPQANVCATATAPSYMRIEIVSDPTSGSATVFDVGNVDGATTIRGFALGTNDDPGSFTPGIYLHEGLGHQIACNHLALDASGESHLGTGAFTTAIDLEGNASHVVVGTNGDGNDDLAERNVFGAGGGYAIYINGNTTSPDHRVSGNYFGFTADGTTQVGSAPVYIRQSASGNLVGTNMDGTSDDLERNYFGGDTAIHVEGATFALVDNQIVGNVFGSTPSGTAAPISIAIAVGNILATSTGNEIKDNYIGSAATGVLISGSEAGAGFLVDGNFFGTDPGDSARPNGTAIRLNGAGASVIANNHIVDSTTAGLSMSGTATLGAGSTGNCLVGNAAGATNTTGSSVTFESNWWGATNGPSGVGPGSGDSVSNDVAFAPWLTTAPAGCSGSVVATFDDVPSTHTFFGDVEWLAAEGITKGCNPPANSLFCPGDSVTRGQMAAFLHRALGGVIMQGPPVTFTDSVGSVFEADIQWLGNTGITKGCNPPTNDMFCPNSVVTRGQMAAFLVRALGLTDDGGGNSFVDDNGSVFEADIAKLAAAGITKGCNPPTNDMFCPNDAVTRGQMAAFLHRALG